MVTLCFCCWQKNRVGEYEEEEDDKIIAVAEGDMSVSHINDISELPAHFIRELETFLSDYKKLENKTVVIEDFQSKFLALNIVDKALQDYQEHFSEGKLITKGNGKVVVDEFRESNWTKKGKKK